LGIPFDGQMLEGTGITDPGIREAIDQEQAEVKPLVGAWFSVLCGSQLRRFGYAEK